MTDKELILELQKQLESTQNIALSYAQAVYMFLGKDISEAELKNIIDQALSERVKNILQHKFIEKDTYSNTFITGFIEDLETDVIDEC